MKVQPPGTAAEAGLTRRSALLAGVGVVAGVAVARAATTDEAGLSGAQLAAVTVASDEATGESVVGYVDATSPSGATSFVLVTHSGRVRVEVTGETVFRVLPFQE